MTENVTQNSTNENTVFGLTAKLNGDASGFKFLRSVFCEIGFIFKFKVDSDGKMGEVTLSLCLSSQILSKRLTVTLRFSLSHVLHPVPTTTASKIRHIG